MKGQNQYKHVGSPKRAGHVCQPLSSSSKWSLKEAVAFRRWGVRTGEGANSHACSLDTSSTGTKAIPGQSQSVLTGTDRKPKGWPCFCSWTLL